MHSNFEMYESDWIYIWCDMNLDLPAEDTKWSKRPVFCSLKKSAFEWTERHPSILVSHVIIYRPCSDDLFDEQVSCSKVPFDSVGVLELVCVNALLMNLSGTMQSVFLYIDLDLSCPTLRGPRVVGQNVEDDAPAKSLPRFSYFPVITSSIQLRKRHSTVRARL